MNERGKLNVADSIEVVTFVLPTRGENTELKDGDLVSKTGLDLYKLVENMPAIGDFIELVQIQDLLWLQNLYTGAKAATTFLMRDLSQEVPH